MIGTFTVIIFNIFIYSRLVRLLHFPIPYYLIEGIVVILAFFIFIDFCRKPSIKRPYILILLMLTISVAGLIGNWRNGYSHSYFGIAKDFYVSWRFVIILLFGIMAGEKCYSYYDRVRSGLIWSARLASIVYLAVGILAYVRHVTWNPLAGCLGEIVMILCVLILSDNTIDLLFMLAACTAAISIKNTTSLAIVGIYLIIVLYKWIAQIRINIPLIVCSVAGAVALGYVEFRHYYMDQEVVSSRLILMKDAMKLAIMNKPVGSGFATFCSQVAMEANSPLYQYFAYDDVMIGCTQDNFWACILGQFGYLGAAVMMLVFLWLLVLCFSQRKNVREFGSMYFCLCFFVVYSLGGNSIFTAASVAFLVFGFAYANPEMRNIRPDSV